MWRLGRQLALVLCAFLAIAAAAGYLLEPGRCAGVGVVLASNYWECGTFHHSVQVRFSRRVTVVPGFRSVAAWSDHVSQPVGYFDSGGYAPGGFHEDHGSWKADIGPQQDLYWEAGVPLWFVAALALIPPAIAARSWWRRRRVVEGRCRVCGYDLRASPQRCPECGTPVAAPAT
jgi:hypothetical protein